MSGRAPSGQALAVPAEPSSTVSALPGFDPSRLPDFNEVYNNRPARPNCDTPVDVDVVARRCVYVNNYRIAGGKPYVSENLPSHTLKTTLGEVLGAFTEGQIRAALKERRAQREYFAAYHAAKANAQEGVSGND